MSKQPDSPRPQTVEVWLDGRLIPLPSERRSIRAIRTYLELLALEQERVLCAFSVDGQSEQRSLACLKSEITAFSRVEAVSISLAELPLRMLETALTETAQARAAVQNAITLVLINNGPVARELWWALARQFKEPLLTLSLLPDTFYHVPAGSASLAQLRQWQLQQLAEILRTVDETCWGADPTALSNALEHRVLPWLTRLHQTILLWRETVLAGDRVQKEWDRDIAAYAKW